MKKLLKIKLLILSLFYYLFSFYISFAENKEPLVHCTDDCDFADALIMIKTIIDFVLFKLLMPIVAIVFAYAGFLLLFSGGDSGKLTTAKKIFWNTFLGFVIALCAWLIVKTIIDLLGFSSDLI